MDINKPISIVIADTAFIIRKGLRSLIQENPDLKYITEASNTNDLHKALAEHEPTVLIVDHCCDDCFSLSEIRKIKREYANVKILVISHKKSAEEIKKVISIGIRNYLLKDCNEHEIIEAIHCCANGDKYFCGQIVDILLEKEVSVKKHCETGGITERELDIIKQFVSGKNSKEVANILHISPYTVNTHKKNIYRKLGIRHAYELAQYAFRTGLME